MQFIKKELLVAMEAIDDLFNANKVRDQEPLPTVVQTCIFMSLRNAAVH